MSGVDRAAFEIFHAIATIIRENPSLRSEIKIALPRGNIPPAFKPERITQGILTGQLWEQFELPFTGTGSWTLNFCNTAPLLCSRSATIIHDAQVFLEPHAYSFAFRTWYKFLLPLVARRAALLLTDSEYSRTQLERFGVAPEGKALVVPLGADHIDRVEPDDSIFDRIGVARDGYILALGSLSPHKNLEILLRVVELLPRGFPPLVVAGGGNPLVHAKAELKGSSQVKIIGRVTDQEMRSLYSHARAFAFPSKTEGFGLPPLEAMMCGCPVVASTGGAIPEVCGEAALLVAPDDLEGWRNALVSVSTDGALRAALREKGLARARRYKWRYSAASILLEISRHDNNAELTLIAQKVLRPTH